MCVPDGALALDPFAQPAASAACSWHPSVKVDMLNGAVDKLNDTVGDLKSNKNETITDIEDSINKLRTQTNTLFSTTNLLNESYNERLSGLNGLLVNRTDEYAENKQEIYLNIAHKHRDISDALL